MNDRPGISAVAAAGIWLVTLIGSWMIGLAVLGSLHEDLFGCGGGASEPSVADPVGPWGWVVLLAAGVVPVLVMVAVAPSDGRLRLVGLSVATAVIGFLAGAAWFGSCL